MMADLSDEEMADREAAIDEWFERAAGTLVGPDRPPPRLVIGPEEWETK